MASNGKKKVAAVVGVGAGLAGRQRDLMPADGLTLQLVPLAETTSLAPPVTALMRSSSAPRR
jgi:hypothetical protein